MSNNDAPNQTADADTLANQCPKCCGSGSIVYLGAPSIVCIDCGGDGQVHTRSVTNGERITKRPQAPPPKTTPKIPRTPQTKTQKRRTEGPGGVGVGSGSGGLARPNGRG